MLPVKKAPLFWTNKRLEAVSRTALTLFQAFLIASTLGGIFGKIASLWLRALLVLVILTCFFVGVVLSDWPLRKEV